MKAVTKKGQLYEPDTLSSIRNSLQRVLTERGSEYNLREGDQFIKCRQVLAARRKQLTKLGKGNKPNASRALSKEEVDHLYSIGFFGVKHPVILQRTVWWIVTTYFGHRARNEARQLNYGDIKIVKNFDSTECLVWDTERSTKTRNGSIPMGHKRQYNPSAFSTKSDKCPVDIYRQFINHRPAEMCLDDSPLFLAVRYNIDDYNQ